MDNREALEKFERLVQQIDTQYGLLGIWELKGGISAQVIGLEVALPDGRTERMVVRRHGPADLRRNPRIAADEYRLLQIVKAVGIPAPKPHHFDQSGEILGTPCVVLEYVEGETDFAPSDLAGFLLQMAIWLARIHNADYSGFDLSFLPEQSRIYGEKFARRPTLVDDSLGEGRIRDALESSWPWPQHNKPVLLHGDYWLGNILWKDGLVVAVIDWEDAHIGDPLADLANSRLEILWAFGMDAMDIFTRQYAAAAHVDFTNLPYWDLCAALRPAFKIGEWAADEAAEKAMRDKHRLFVGQAFAKLPGSSNARQ